MRCTLLTKFLAFVMFAAILLSGCASTPVQTVKKDRRPPLPEGTPVFFIYGPMTPIIPETSEYVTTVETNFFAGGCSPESASAFLERRARESGANLVFIKRVRKAVYNHQVCHIFLVDFLADFPGGQNEN